MQIWQIKFFAELTAEELFEIYRLRIAVFVVEQNCPYQEVDEADRTAIHVALRDETGILAYLRVLPADSGHPVRLGRVIAVRRRCGFGTQVVQKGIAVAQERFGATVIELDAQVYARSLYEKIGFQAVSDEFSEDGIPHIRMRCIPKAREEI